MSKIKTFNKLIVTTNGSSFWLPENCINFTLPTFSSMFLENDCFSHSLWVLGYSENYKFSRLRLKSKLF